MGVFSSITELIGADEQCQNCHRECSRTTRRFSNKEVEELWHIDVHEYMRKIEIYKREIDIQKRSNEIMGKVINELTKKLNDVLEMYNKGENL